MKGLRFWVVSLLLAGTVFVLHTRGNSEPQVAREPLSQLPHGIAGWTGSDRPIDPEALAVLGPGSFLSRVYAKSSETPPIDLFIGYFPTQRTGVTIHSPKHCLPGAGWAFESSEYVTLSDVNGKPHRVGEYIIADSDSKQLVIYWYQAHGHSEANEYAAKFYLIADAIRMNRTDGALVRVITPIDFSGVPAAKARAELFTTQLFSSLPRFIPD